MVVPAFLLLCRFSGHSTLQLPVAIEPALAFVIVPKFQWKPGADWQVKYGPACCLNEVSHRPCKLMRPLPKATITPQT
jgi:hypothetical protein